MDAWLSSHQEMAWNEEAIILNNHGQNKEIEALGQEFAFVFGEDFSFLGEEITISSLLNNGTSENPTKLLDQSISNNNDKQPPQLSEEDSPIIQQAQDDHYPTRNSSNIATKDLSDDNHQTTKCGKKRRRDPIQVHSHILAERKRRELLSQRFIALSALIPGLKKVDKTSIIEEAIKHLKQMQEKVRLLEEKVVAPTMVVKRTHLNLSDSDANNCASGGSDDGHQSVATLPEIQVKVSHKTLLLNICCVRRKGILGRLCEEMENHNMSILNTTVVTFETSTLDITILAKMEAAEDCDRYVRDLVKSLHSTLRIS